MIARHGGDNRAGDLRRIAIDEANALWHPSAMDASALIYKIVPASLWRQAQAAGSFAGAPVDRADGYIHFSAADQVRETARRHFAGIDGLLLVAVDPGVLGDALKWEPSRGGAPFPHLYAPLPTASAIFIEPLPLGDDGEHVFPDALR